MLLLTTGVCTVEASAFHTLDNNNQQTAQPRLVHGDAELVLLPVLMVLLLAVVDIQILVQYMPHVHGK